MLTGTFAHLSGQTLSPAPGCTQVAAAFNALSLPTDPAQRNATLQQFIAQAGTLRWLGRACLLLEQNQAWRAASMHRPLRAAVPACMPPPHRAAAPPRHTSLQPRNACSAGTPPGQMYLIPAPSHPICGLLCSLQWLLPPGQEMTNATGVLEQDPPAWFEARR